MGSWRKQLGKNGSKMVEGSEFGNGKGCCTLTRGIKAAVLEDEVM